VGSILSSPTNEGRDSPLLPALLLDFCSARTQFAPQSAWQPPLVMWEAQGREWQRVRGIGESERTGGRQSSTRGTRRRASPPPENNRPALVALLHWGCAGVS
jgi:hypothetical protein